MPKQFCQDNYICLRSIVNSGDTYSTVQCLLTSPWGLAISQQLTAATKHY